MLESTVLCVLSSWVEIELVVISVPFVVLRGRRDSRWWLMRIGV
jgi:hypothetical protein